MESYSLVYKFFGITFSESMDMDFLLFAELLRDAEVMRLKETQEGQDYLEKCWTLKQTAPDRAALRKQFDS